MERRISKRKEDGVFKGSLESKRDFNEPKKHDV